MTAVGVEPMRSGVVEKTANLLATLTPTRVYITFMSTGTCVVGFSTSIAFDLIDFFLSEWVAEYGRSRAKGEGAAARISKRSCTKPQSRVGVFHRHLCHAPYVPPRSV